MDAKVVAAAAFAAVGVGVGLWGLLGAGGSAVERGAAVGETPVLRPVDDAGALVEPAYESTRGRGALGVTSAIASAALGVARSAVGLEDARAGAFVGSVEGVVGPLLEGDHDGFLAAMRAMGGRIAGDLAGEHPLFKALASKMEGAEVDVSRLTVKAYRPALIGGGPGGVPVAENRGGGATRSVSLSVSEEDDDRSVRRVQEMRPGGLFPGATAMMDERAVEVSFPFLPRGDAQEQWFGVVLVWNDELSVWQPGTFRLTVMGRED